MHAVRKLAYITFVHMHELSLRFHLERKTGAVHRRANRPRSRAAKALANPANREI